MQDELIRLTKELMAVPSIKARPQELERVLEIAQRELHGFAFEEFVSNNISSLLYYNTEKRPEKFRLILNAHLDVVPGTEEQYTPVEKDGMIIGRGAYDMKAGAASMILAFRDVAKQVNYPLALQLVTDEELGGKHGAKYQIEQGIRGEFALGAEPSNLKLSYKSKGIMGATVNFRGKTAHAAYPWDGDNALWKMKHFLDDLEKKFPVPEKVAWVTTVNVANIETSNKTHNKVPDDCTVLLDIRYIPEDQDTIVDTIKSLIPAEASLEIRHNDPAHHTDRENPTVLLVKNAVQEVTGVVPDFIVKHGASDLRHFSAVDCPGMNFGPVGAGLHSDNEWVDINSLEQHLTIVKTFLLSVDR